MKNSKKTTKQLTLKQLVKPTHLSEARRKVKEVKNILSFFVEKGFEIDNLEQSAISIVIHNYKRDHGFVTFHLPTSDQLDGIYQICNIWKSYIPPKYLGTLAIHCLSRMAWMHCVVLSISGSADVDKCNTRAFIGKYAPIKRYPNIGFTTIVHPAGNVRVL